MFYRWRNRFHKWNFNRKCRPALSGRPLRTEKNGLLVVTQVCHSDVTMYLMAVKSFLERVGFGSPVAIDDGSLTAEDKAVLARQLPALRIVPIKSVDTGRCPVGGTWERLLYIVDRCAEDYVVQVDSDTLTVQDVPEVQAAIRENRPFILGTSHGKRIEPIAESVARMEKIGSTHVQAMAERGFARLSGYPDLRYCRGCSGFAGFARGSVSRAGLEGFSLAMEGLLGRKWYEWGSEQVASNFVLANAPGAGVLPYPAYSEFNPAKDNSGNRFLHFIGTYRWDGGAYLRYARDWIRRG